MIVNHEFGLPRRATTGSCGYDLVTPIDIDIYTDRWTTFSLELQLEDGDLPSFSYMEIVPRSSTGFKYGLRLANTTGVVDSDYRKPINAKLIADQYALIERASVHDESVFVQYSDINEDVEPKFEYGFVHLDAGERILQGIVHSYELINGEEPPIVIRYDGLGSTGKK